MPRFLPALVSALMFAACTIVASGSSAQQGSWERERDQSWYDQQPTESRPDPRSIICYKAQVRAAQRNARVASMSWYGMSNSRPTAAPTPFMTLYSPVWQMPGGRPFAWHTSSWPSAGVIYVR